jgi:hypothetical protein
MDRHGQQEQARQDQHDRLEPSRQFVTPTRPFDDLVLDVRVAFRHPASISQTATLRQSGLEAYAR